MSKDPRLIELAKIHIGRDQIGMPVEAYRDLLWTLARVRSSADLDEYGRKKIIAHLERCGATFAKKKRPRPARDKAGLVSKIRAMLAEANRQDAYADGMAQKMFKVDRFEWLDPDQLRRLVAALVYDAKRRARS